MVFALYMEEKEKKIAHKICVKISFVFTCKILNFIKENNW